MSAASTFTHYTGVLPFRQAGSTSGFEIASAAAADEDGNFFLAGRTSSSVDGEAVNVGGLDFAVIKLSSVDGSVVWSWQVGSFSRPSVAFGGKFSRGLSLWASVLNPYGRCPYRQG